MPKKADYYYEGVGRRKRSIARVRIVENEKEPTFLINEKEAESFLNVENLIMTIKAPLVATAMEKKFAISAKVRGGGIRGQADAVQLGLSRALVKFNDEFQRTLRDLDYLKRDPRKKERKKPGLKKARRAPQWSKR